MVTESAMCLVASRKQLPTPTGYAVDRGRSWSALAMFDRLSGLFVACRVCCVVCSGILTPASAFGQVLLDRLKAPGGLKIEILYAKTMDVAKPVSK